MKKLWSDWEVSVAVVAAATAIILLVRLALGWGQPDSSNSLELIAMVSWVIAVVLASGFGVATAMKLRSSDSGKSLALMMSLLAVALAGTLSVPLPAPFGLVTLLAFWGLVGAALLFSKSLVGVVPSHQLSEAGPQTLLARLVRPAQVNWLMRNATPVWWFCLVLWVVLFGLTGALSGPIGDNNVPATVLATLLTVATLVLIGTALSNVAGGSGSMGPREWRAFQWLLWAFLAATLCMVGSVIGYLSFLLDAPVFDWISLGLVAAAPLVLVLGVIMAVIGFGAVDPSFALRRTLSIGLIGLVWIAAFATLEELLARSVSTQLGISQSVVSWCIVVGTAAALTPAQRWLERKLGRGGVRSVDTSREMQPPT